MKVIATKAKIFRDSANHYWMRAEGTGKAWMGNKELARMLGIELEPWESQDIEIRVIKRGVK